MKQILLVLALLYTTYLSAHIVDRIDREILIQVAIENSNLAYLEKLFPDTKITPCAKQFQLWTVEFPSVPPMDYIQKLKHDGKIKLSTRNRKLEPRATTPNDSFFSKQTFHLNSFNPGQSVTSGINSVGAWDFNKSGVTAKGDSIVVAVLDFGFDSAHSDLDYFVNHNESPHDGIDNDDNGAIDDYKGWNTGLDNHSLDGSENDHGTMVCGGIGAIGNNKIGVTGVAWNCKLLPINNIASIAKSIKALEYCLVMKRLYSLTNKGKGAYIVAINYSLGTEGLLPEDAPLWCIIIDAMGKEGILLTAAVSNQSLDVESYKDMPILCNSPYQINVTTYNSLSLGLDKSAFSNKFVHIAAPHNYWGTLMNNKYGTYKDGASFAAPLIAGTIALMYSNFEVRLLDSLHRNPTFITQKIKEAILKNVDVTSGLTNKVVSNGKLNLFKTISYSRFLHDSIYKKKDTIFNSISQNSHNIQASIYHSEKNIYIKKIDQRPLYISIYNILGQAVLQLKVLDMETKIDLQNLNEGLYILTSSMVGYHQSQKIVLE